MGRERIVRVALVVIILLPSCLSAEPVLRVGLCYGYLASEMDDQGDGHSVSFQFKYRVKEWLWPEWSFSYGKFGKAEIPGAEHYGELEGSTMKALNMLLHFGGTAEEKGDAQLRISFGIGPTYYLLTRRFDADVEGVGGLVCLSMEFLGEGGGIDISCRRAFFGESRRTWILLIGLEFDGG